MTYRQPTINFHSSSGPVASAAPIGQPTTSYMVADPNPSYAEFGKKSIVHDGYQSVLVKDNTHYQNTEKLYRPLKDTLSHPQWSREHAQYAPEVSQTSQVSKRYRRLDTKEISNIQQNTYIPDAELIPTGNLDRVRGERFVAVDASRREGQPITQEEFERIQSRGFQNSQVVYEIGERQSTVVEKPAPREEKTTYVEPEVKETVVYEEYIRQPDYKYNLFSCLDRPVNECRLFGCGKCSGCPGNEGVAREHYDYATLRRYSTYQN